MCIKSPVLMYTKLLVFDGQILKLKHQLSLQNGKQGCWKLVQNCKLRSNKKTIKACCIIKKMILMANEFAFFYSLDQFLSLRLNNYSETESLSISHVGVSNHDSLLVQNFSISLVFKLLSIYCYTQNTSYKLSFLESGCQISVSSL